MLTLCGNPALLSSRSVAVVNSFHGKGIRPEDDWVRATVALAARAVEEGFTLVASVDLVTYELATLRGLRDSARLILVLQEDVSRWMDGLHPALLSDRIRTWPADREGRLLLVSPFLPGAAPESHRERMPIRDRCVLGLSEYPVAVQIRAGGKMERELGRSIGSGARVSVCRFETLSGGRAGNRTLLEKGAFPLTPDPEGHALPSVLRVLEESATEPSEDEESRRRQYLGQFFTPPAVARFICRVVHAYAKATDARGSGARRPRLIDPAVGEGVFLQNAFEQGLAAPEHSLGIDLDDRLLTTWREAFGRAAHPAMHVGDGLVNNEWIGLKPDAYDYVLGNPPFGAGVLRCLTHLLPARARARGVREDTPSLFEEPIGVSEPDLGDAVPPLTGLRRDEVLRLARSLINEYESWRLGVIGSRLLECVPSEPGLFDAPPPPTESPTEQARTAIVEWERERPFDFASLRLDGEPIGPRVREALKRLSGYAIEVLFVERFLQLARPGGIVGVIVPDGILSNDQVQPFRDWLLQRAQLLAIVSLPWRVFTGVGANAKTSILFMRKLLPSSRDGARAVPAVGETVLLCQEAIGRSLQEHLDRAEHGALDHAERLREPR